MVIKCFEAIDNIFNANTVEMDSIISHEVAHVKKESDTVANPLIFLFVFEKVEDDCRLKKMLLKQYEEDSIELDKQFRHQLQSIRNNINSFSKNRGHNYNLKDCYVSLTRFSLNNVADGRNNSSTKYTNKRLNEYSDGDEVSSKKICLSQDANVFKQGTQFNELNLNNSHAQSNDKLFKSCNILDRNCLINCSVRLNDLKSVDNYGNCNSSDRLDFNVTKHETSTNMQWKIIKNDCGNINKIVLKRKSFEETYKFPDKDLSNCNFIGEEELYPYRNGRLKLDFQMDINQENTIGYSFIDDFVLFLDQEIVRLGNKIKSYDLKDCSVAISRSQLLENLLLDWKRWMHEKDVLVDIPNDMLEDIDEPTLERRAKRLKKKRSKGKIPFISRRYIKYLLNTQYHFTRSGSKSPLSYHTDSPTSTESSGNLKETEESFLDEHCNIVEIDAYTILNLLNDRQNNATHELSNEYKIINLINSCLFVVRDYRTPVKIKQEKPDAFKEEMCVNVDNTSNTSFNNVSRCIFPDADCSTPEVFHKTVNSPAKDEEISNKSPHEDTQILIKKKNKKSKRSKHRVKDVSLAAEENLMSHLGDVVAEDKNNTVDVEDYAHLMMPENNNTLNSNPRSDTFDVTMLTDLKVRIGKNNDAYHTVNKTENKHMRSKSGKSKHKKYHKNKRKKKHSKTDKSKTETASYNLRETTDDVQVNKNISNKYNAATGCVGDKTNKEETKREVNVNNSSIKFDCATDSSFKESETSDVNCTENIKSYVSYRNKDKSVSCKTKGKSDVSCRNKDKSDVSYKDKSGSDVSCKNKNELDVSYKNKDKSDASCKNKVKSDVNSKNKLRSEVNSKKHVNSRGSHFHDDSYKNVHFRRLRRSEIVTNYLFSKQTRSQDRVNTLRIRIK